MKPSLLSALYNRAVDAPLQTLQRCRRTDDLIQLPLTLLQPGALVVDLPEHRQPLVASAAGFGDGGLEIKLLCDLRLGLPRIDRALHLDSRDIRRISPAKLQRIAQRIAHALVDLERSADGTHARAAGLKTFHITGEPVHGTSELLEGDWLAVFGMRLDHVVQQWQINRHPTHGCAQVVNAVAAYEGVNGRPGQGSDNLKRSVHNWNDFQNGLSVLCFLL